jgi:hypothetical protein
MMSMPSPWLTVVIGGALSAALYLAAPATPATALLGSLTQAPLFFVGLWLGAPGALAASGIAAVGISVFAGFGLVAALLFMLIHAGPVVLLTRQALLSRSAAGGGVEWYPPGLLVCWLVGLGVACFALALIAFAGWEGGLAGAVRSRTEALLPAIERQVPAARLLLDAVAPVIPGFVIAVWMSWTVVNGSLAQGLAKALKRNRRPSPDIGDTVLPRWVFGALAAAAVAALVGPGLLGYAGANLTVILLVPFLFVGLAVVHRLSRRMKGRAVALGIIYAMMLVFGWPILAIVGLGLVEQWIGLRRRFAGAPDGER